MFGSWAMFVLGERGQVESRKRVSLGSTSPRSFPTKKTQHVISVVIFPSWLVLENLCVRRRRDESELRGKLRTIVDCGECCEDNVKTWPRRSRV